MSTTVEAFKQVLLKAKTVAIPGSTSGIWLTNDLFPRLGIAEKPRCMSASPRKRPFGHHHAIRRLVTATRRRARVRWRRSPRVGVTAMRMRGSRPLAGTEARTLARVRRVSFGADARARRLERSWRGSPLSFLYHTLSAPSRSWRRQCQALRIDNHFRVVFGSGRTTLSDACRAAPAASSPVGALTLHSTLSRRGSIYPPFVASSHLSGWVHRAVPPNKNR